MNVSSPQFFMQRYSNLKAGGTNTPKREVAQTRAANANSDSISISPQARQASEKSRDLTPLQSITVKAPTQKNHMFGFSGALAFTNRAWQGEQTAAEAATGYKYYTELGRTSKETDLSLDAERDSLGSKIDKALQSAGVELADDEKLKFTVDKDGKVSIDPNGLSKKNRGNVQAIEEALNATPGLAKDLYLNSAAQTLNNAQKKIEDYSASGPYVVGGSDANESAAQRESVDDWLRSTLGFGFDELEAEGYFDGNPEQRGQYSQALDEYKYNELDWNEMINLNQTLMNVSENSKAHGNPDYKASFTYQGGSLSHGSAGNNKKAAEKADSAASDAVNEATSETEETVAGESRDKSTDINAATANFKDVFKAALGFNQPFGLQLNNGMFSLSNAAFLSNTSRNAATSIINQLNSNTIDPQSDLSKSAQALRGLVSDKSINISF